MPAIKSLEELKRLREQAIEQREAKQTSSRVQVVVGMGTCGIAAGARETVKAILEEIEAENLSGVLVKQTGCIGLCEQEPLVDVVIGEERVRYGKVTPERAKTIMREHVLGGRVVSAFRVPEE